MEPLMTGQPFHVSSLPSFKFPARSELWTSVPPLRCDQCRKGLGHHIYRYWHMRFCSSACMTAYTQRLDDETRVKIRHLEKAPTCR